MSDFPARDIVKTLCENKCFTHRKKTAFLIIPSLCLIAKMSVILSPKYNIQTIQLFTLIEEEEGAVPI